MKTNLRSLAVLLMVLTLTIAKAQTFINFTTSSGLPDNNVNGVAIDQNNVKWFGTQSGVARFDDVSWTVYTTVQGVVDNYIKCIAVDKSNHIWVGTDVGVCMFNGTTWTTYTSAQGLVNDQVNYISTDLNGKVWFATISGISVFDGTTWKTYTTADGLPNDMVSYITPDSTGNVWIGTWIGGLAKFNGTTFQVFTTLDSLASNNIISIAVDGSGNKWIGTYSGISVFDNNDVWIRNYKQTDGLYNNYVQDLTFDSDGILWIGMYADYLQDGGLTQHSGTTWTSYSTAEGLVDPQVKRIAVDHQDNLWAVTGNGVSRWNNPSSGTGSVRTGTSFTLYPNPADTYFFLDHTSAITVEVLDLTGKTVLFKNLGTAEKTIDISTLSPGVYFVRTASGDDVYSSKLIVK